MLGERGAETEKKFVGEERNGYVCKKNGSIGASEGYTNCKVF